MYLRTIKHGSPDSLAVNLEVEHPAPVYALNGEDLDRLRPEYVARIMKAGPISFSVRSTQSFFDEDFMHLHRNGVFVIFIPSGVEARLKVGHLMFVADDALFDRKWDEQGPLALRSIPASQL